MHFFTAFSISLALLLCAFDSENLAKADTWGSPGLPHHWSSGLKQVVGTSFENGTSHSPVWFTAADGILTEVYYPTVDQAQIGDLQFLVTDGQTFFSEQKRDTVSEVSYSNEGMSVHISGQEKFGRYAFEQDIVTDSAAPVVRIRTTIKRFQAGLRLYVLFKPAINNSGSNNMGLASANGLFASKESKSTHAAVLSSIPFGNTSVGYVGFSDGLQDISKNYRLTQLSFEAGPGNIALTGEIPMPNAGTDFTYELALSFGGTRSEAQTYAQTSLSIPFDHIQQTYETGWKSYIQKLLESPLNKGKRFLNESFFARRSAQLIKIHEDKFHPGALVAGGNHVVKSRDSYHSAMGLLAAGDIETPVRILKYLEKAQRLDGTWPQKLWVTGASASPSAQAKVQMEDVAFPILLAAHLQLRGVLSLNRADIEMVRRAANYIIQNGPTTALDRWEETGGYSPNTIAVEITALRMAHLLTGEKAALDTADLWQSMLESWTLVQKGPLGRSYYLRISSTGKPEEPDPIVLSKGTGRIFAAEMIDGGFLDLVRYRIRSFNDPRILNTLQIYESPLLGLALTAPSSQGAMAYRRYNGDVYGPGKVGGFWPLLAGERGHYAIAAGNIERARAELFALERSALSTDLLPEQTISPPPSQGTSSASFGEGTISPFIWAHAEDILLHRSIEEGIIFDSPQQQPSTTTLKKVPLNVF